MTIFMLCSSIAALAQVDLNQLQQRKRRYLELPRSAFLPDLVPQQLAGDTLLIFLIWIDNYNLTNTIFAYFINGLH